MPAEIQFTFKTAQLEGLRDAKGRFVRGSAQTNMLNRNRMLRVRLQEVAAKEVERSIGTRSGKWASARQYQSMGRLARATAHPNNSTADAFNVGIGNPDWLDRSEAFYWRGFEFGTDKFVGRRIAFTTRDRASRGRGQKDPLIRMVSNPGGDEEDGGGKQREMWINRPIQAHHVYRNLHLEQEISTAMFRNAQDYVTGLISEALHG